MSSQLPAARLARVLEYVELRGHATVAELASEFNVSRDTARRDIDKLTDQGFASRTHGGIVAARDLTGRTVSHKYRASENLAAKRLVGRRAAALVKDGETLFVGGGTTTLEVIRALGASRDLTIVTNSLLVPAEVPPGTARQILVLGGRFSATTLSTDGPLELPGLSHLVADRAFVSVGGISSNGDLCVADANDAQLVRRMLLQAKEPVVVADSSKFDRDVFARAATLDEITALVCDRPPTGALLARLTESSATLIAA